MMKAAIAALLIHNAPIETQIINEVAQEYGLTEHETAILVAIRLTENGGINSQKILYTGGILCYSLPYQMIQEDESCRRYVEYVERQETTMSFELPKTLEASASSVIGSGINSGENAIRILIVNGDNNITKSTGNKYSRRRRPTIGNTGLDTKHVVKNTARPTQTKYTSSRKNGTPKSSCRSGYGSSCSAEENAVAVDSMISLPYSGITEIQGLNYSHLRTMLTGLRLRRMKVSQEKSQSAISYVLIVIPSNMPRFTEPSHESLAGNYQIDLSNDSAKPELILRYEIRNGKEFGIEVPAAQRYADDYVKSLRLQAQYAAGTIKKRYAGDLKAFARRYCPANWQVWYKNAKYFMEKANA